MLSCEGCCKNKTFETIFEEVNFNFYEFIDGSVLAIKDPSKHCTIKGGSTTVVENSI